MLFFFYGDNQDEARLQAQKNIQAAQKKHPTAEFFRLNTENFSMARLEDLITSQGLFYSGSIVFLDHVLVAEQGEQLLKKIKEIASSPNFFIFLESKINKKDLDKLEKSAIKVQVFNRTPRRLTKKESLALKGEKIDFFEFSDALGARDRKGLWTLYQDALAEGVPAEEVHGIFFWQIKSMIVASKSQTPAESGLKPYVFDKARGYVRNYSSDKLESMSRDLFTMYHEAHRGKIDFSVALERFILEI
jgi:DNA polymerase III delta subunit